MGGAAGAAGGVAGVPPAVERETGAGPEGAAVAGAAGLTLVGLTAEGRKDDAALPGAVEVELAEVFAADWSERVPLVAVAGLEEGAGLAGADWVVAGVVGPVREAAAPAVAPAGANCGREVVAAAGGGLD